MALTTNLLSQFVKSTKDDVKTNNENTTYGTISTEGEGVLRKTYVTIDGSNEKIEVLAKQRTTSVDDGDRVEVTVKNHSVFVTGNMSNPSATTGGVTSLFDAISTEKVSTKQLAAEVARIDVLEAEYLNVSEELAANTASIASLEATNVDVTERLTAAEADISNLQTDKLSAETAVLTYATIKDLDAAKADIYSLESTYGEFVDLTTKNFTAVDADIAELQTTKLDAADADIIKADITNLESELADIDTLIFGSATGDTIQTSFSNSVIAQLGDAQIKSAMIESVSASKITAGDIITNQVRVKSEDGSLLISDETMQISDDTRVRVQIGKDSSGDYSINIWDADGNLMFSKGGITDAAIKDAIIRNDMVSDTANIAAHKLDIDSLFEEINDSTNTIKATQIYIDDKEQTLEVAFKELDTTVTDLGSTVSTQGTQITTIQGQITSKIWQQDIETAVEEIDIGGRNLIQGTSDEWRARTTTNAYTVVIAISPDGLTHFTLEELGLSVGENITLSFDIQTSSGKLIRPRIRFQDSEGATVKDVKNTNIFVQNGEGYLWVTASIPENSARLVLLGDTNETASTVTGGSTEYVKRVKLERGNKPTDWTPAPEDTKNEITTLTTKYSTLEQTVDGVSATVAEHTSQIADKANSATVTSISDRVTTVETNLDGITATVEQHTSQIADKAESSTVTEVNNKVTTLESTLDGFQTTVSETYATKTELNAVEVGARNYALASEEEKTASPYYVLYELSAAKAALQDRSVVVSFEAMRPEDSSEANVYAYFRGSSPLTPYSNYIGDVTHEYKRYYVTIEPGVDLDEATHISVHPTVGSSNMSVRNVKVEAGTLPTDWTQAPEDIDGEISSLVTRISDAETSIAQNEEAIELRATHTQLATAKTEAIESANENTVALLTSYSTTAQMEAAIKLESDTITSHVSETYATITSLSSVETTANAAQEAVDNLSVGGRNYLLNSGAQRVCARAVVDFNLSQDLDWLKTKTGEEVMFSFEAKGNEDCDYQIDTYFRGDVTSFSNSPEILTLTTEYERYRQHMIVPSIPDDDTEVVVRIRGNQYVGNGTNTGNFYIRNAKLEFGNMLTDWTPAPEDMATEADLTKAENRITSAESSITQNAESITSAVSRIANNESSITTLTQTADGLEARVDSAEANITKAQSTAEDAAKTATNYMSFSDEGLVVGDMTASTLQKNVRIDSDSVDIRDGDDILASYQGNKIKLGLESTEAVISFFGDDNATLVAAQNDQGYRTGLKFNSGYFETEGNYVSQVVHIPGYEDADDSRFGRFIMRTDATNNVLSNTLDTVLNYGDLQYGSYIGGYTEVNDDDTQAYAKMAAEYWTGSIWKENRLKVAYDGTTLYDYTHSGPIRPWNKVLWSGGYYMTSGHTCTLSEAVTAQPTGIILVFSEFYDGAKSDTAFHTRFVPKQMITSHGGCGHCFQMSTSNLAYYATKYLYIHDTKIVGHDNNSLESSSTCGITRTNTRFVLRYVIGV